MGLNNARRSLLFATATMFATTLLCGAALAYPADLDTTFSGDGRVVTDFAPPDDPRDESARDVLVQPDGRLLAAGYAQPGQGGSGGGLAMARYNLDGSLDVSFGPGGKVTDSSVSGAKQIALQSDGKIVALADGVVARYNPDGSVDASFGSGGQAPLSTSYESYRSSPGLAIQQDDKILVVGGVRRYDANYNSADDLAVTRYEANGALDTGFGSAGTQTVDFGGYEWGGNDGGYGINPLAIAIDPVSGKVVLAGTHIGSLEQGYSDFAVAKLNADGSFDDTFDGDGKLISYITSKDDYANDVLVQPDGKIVVGGQSNYNAVLVRYNADGSLDSSFDGDGKALNTSRSRYMELGLQADGKVVALNGYDDWGVTRHRTDGSVDRSLDLTYGWDERVYPSAYGMAVQPDGRVVLAGSISSNGWSDFAVARYLGGSDDGAPETTITGKPPAATPDNYAQFSSSSSETRSTYECSLDGAAFENCYEGYEYYSQLAEGAHAFEVRATDGAGNTDQTPARWTWNVDTVRPGGKVTINGGRAVTKKQTVALGLAAADPAPSSGVSQMRLMNAGGRWSAWMPYATTKTWRLTPRAGTKTVYGQFRDRAGNISATAFDKISYRP